MDMVLALVLGALGGLLGQRIGTARTEPKRKPRRAAPAARSAPIAPTAEPKPGYIPAGLLELEKRLDGATRKLAEREPTLAMDWVPLVVDLQAHAIDDMERLVASIHAEMATGGIHATTGKVVADVYRARRAALMADAARLTRTHGAKA